MIFRNKQQIQTGFTLIELIVVIGILGLLFSALMLNFAGQRAPRALKIAQNELVSNIRKVQSYTYSARDTSAGPVKYYALKFDTATPSYYLIQSVQNDYSFQGALETINLPTDVKLTDISLNQPIGAGASHPACLQVLFSLPYGRIYLDDSCTSDSIVHDPAALSALANSEVTLTLTVGATGATKTITINGASGSITF